MRILIVLARVLLFVTLLGVARERDEKAVPGQPVPDFVFQTVLGGDGRTKLSEFRGQPVLIAWYSTVFADIEGARAAVGIDEECNKGSWESKLVVFLMEIKNNDATYLRALQMAELPGAQCRLLRNHRICPWSTTTRPGHRPR